LAWRLLAAPRSRLSAGKRPRRRALADGRPASASMPLAVALRRGPADLLARDDSRSGANDSRPGDPRQGHVALAPGTPLEITLDEVAPGARRVIYAEVEDAREHRHRQWVHARSHHRVGQDRHHRGRTLLLSATLLISRPDVALDALGAVPFHGDELDAHAPGPSVAPAALTTSPRATTISLSPGGRT